MSEVIVLCPTRGRPGGAAALVQSFRETAHLMATQIILVVDRDDPLLPEYARLPSQFMHNQDVPLDPPDPPRLMVLEAHETGSLTAATNTAARRVWDDDCIIGHVGDDHRFRTPGWDKAIVAALADPGVAYGDDGLKGARLPTAVFMSSVIPRTLGWYALPGTQHMYIDNAWREIGKGLGRLRYLPDVLIEHMHPSAGKAPPDERYAVAKVAKGEDRQVYRHWMDALRPLDLHVLGEAIA